MLLFVTITVVVLIIVSIIAFTTVVKVGRTPLGMYVCIYSKDHEVENANRLYNELFDIHSDYIEYNDTYYDDYDEDTCYFDYDYYDEDATYHEPWKNDCDDAPRNEYCYNDEPEHEDADAWYKQINAQVEAQYSEYDEYAAMQDAIPMPYVRKDGYRYDMHDIKELRDCTSKRNHSGTYKIGKVDRQRAAEHKRIDRAYAMFH